MKTDCLLRGTSYRGWTK